ncbi:hypothetical protein NWFMUON74_35720 [Nocardia wallacei]|uniref:Uncharacterized protein n=1 Tax=Nocardia wallacei TaxID=480035 RepID=A0A7G1KL86_9NOCA|nr:hypothetical protein NWFMUON74_35720 [Nocardia wallacei]
MVVPSAETTVEYGRFGSGAVISFLVTDRCSPRPRTSRVFAAGVDVVRVRPERDGPGGFGDTSHIRCVGAASGVGIPAANVDRIAFGRR